MDNLNLNFSQTFLLIIIIINFFFTYSCFSLFEIWTQRSDLFLILFLFCSYFPLAPEASSVFLFCWLVCTSYKLLLFFFDTYKLQTSLGGNHQLRVWDLIQTWWTLMFCKHENYLGSLFFFFGNRYFVHKDFTTQNLNLVSDGQKNCLNHYYGWCLYCW